MVLQRKERLFDKAMKGWAKARKEKRLVAMKIMKEAADRLDKEIQKCRWTLNRALKKERQIKELEKK
jgi:hypothetical protein